MPKFERPKDKWKELRKDLYGNVEPEVRLEAVTVPLKTIEGAGGMYADAMITDMWYTIEELPAISAGVSYGSKDKMENDHERAIKLNKKLVGMGHHTPLEAIQLNFYVSGISKACGAQISRHRVGQGHVSASRRFQTAGPGFVYPMLDYIDDDKEVSRRLRALESINRNSYEIYEFLRRDSETTGWSGDFGGSVIEHKVSLIPLHKEDARMVLPVSYATERTWWLNVRALRDFFRLRLAADAEWEVRRLAFMVYDLVQPLLPSLFDDFAEELYKS